MVHLVTQGGISGVMDGYIPLHPRFVDGGATAYRKTDSGAYKTIPD
jgi:hypothetical protein